MDWRSVQFDWNLARAFLVTAEEGSLSAAAWELGLTQPTLGRQVADQSNTIEGSICISATDLVTILAMPILVQKLRRLYPE
jgi:hypothetical protein